jgi:hypothetical protein
MKSLILLLLITVINSFAQQPFPPENNPWPEIRKQRIEKLLPAGHEVIRNRLLD